GEPIGLLARRLQHVKCEALRALRADARQALQLFDEADERVWERHCSQELGPWECGFYSPGSLSPGGNIPPTFLCISSSALRCASLSAATIRSCSIATSSFDTTSGSILIDCTCFAPLTTTVTMPPPAFPSTRRSVICFCRRSCICCACFIIC